MWAKYEAEKFRMDAVISKAAADLAERLGMDVPAVIKTLEGIQLEFGRWVSETECVEKASQAKSDLRKLARKADELKAAMQALGQGAWEVMQRPTVREDLWVGADPEGLPWRDPMHFPMEIMGLPREERARIEEEWSNGGRWVIRLDALAELARTKADRIEKITGKGGNKNFGARLHGSPQDWLAKTCTEFVEARGCHSQTVALKMVRAVLEAEHGRNLKKSSGRKAVRKMAQTNSKVGTV
jgi:hypothetical protein